MAIPSYEEMMSPILNALNQKNCEMSLSDIENEMAKEFNLSQAERLERYKTRGGIEKQDELDYCLFIPSRIARETQESALSNHPNWTAGS